MKRSLMILAACALALSAVSADAATKCKDPTTHKFIKCSAAASSAPASSAPAHKSLSSLFHSSGTPTRATTTASTSTGGSGHAPHCVKGKPCGNSCIAQKDVCHKG